MPEEPVKTPEKDVKVETKEPKSHGGRNLVIMGIGAIVVALVSTGISLQIYRATGDIYLDRSRPGYISESDKVDSKDKDETFSDTGDMNDAAVDLYIKELDATNNKIKALSGDFSEEPISDDSLGINPNPTTTTDNTDDTGTTD